MKKIWKWVFVGVVVFLTFLFLVCLKSDNSKISIFIQALGIEALVFVTIFYAVQTQKLVDEQAVSRKEDKEKYFIEFITKRIGEFYLPFIQRIVAIQSDLNTTPFDELEFIKKHVEFHIFYWAKRYMISHSTIKIIEKYYNSAYFAGAERKRKDIIIEEYRSAKDNVVKLINAEINKDEEVIRKYYESGLRVLDEKSAVNAAGEEGAT